MTIRMALNFTAILSAFIFILLSLLAYGSKAWVERMENLASANEGHYYELKPRVTKLESDSELQWKNNERRLESVEKKLDILISRR